MIGSPNITVFQTISQSEVHVTAKLKGGAVVWVLVGRGDIISFRHIQTQQSRRRTSPASFAALHLQESLRLLFLRNCTCDIL